MCSQSIPSDFTVSLIGEHESDGFDSFVESSPYGNIFQTYGWGEVRRTLGIIPIRIAVREKGDICGTIALQLIRIPGTPFNILYGARGPILDFDRLEVLKALVSFLHTYAPKNRCIFLKVDPPIPIEYRMISDHLIASGFQLATYNSSALFFYARNTLQINLQRTSEQAFEILPKKTRYAIRSAAAQGVTVEKTINPEAATQFRHLLACSATRQGFPVQPLSYFESILRILGPQGRATLFLVRFEGKIIAGNISLRCGKYAQYGWAGHNSTARLEGPRTALWNAIVWAIENDAEYFDLRGPGEAGLRHFKESFGPAYIQYIGNYDLVFRPKLYNWWIKANPIFKHLVSIYKRFHTPLR